MKIEFDEPIPDGYEFAAFDYVCKDDVYWNGERVKTWDWHAPSSHKYIHLRRSPRDVRKGDEGKPIQVWCGLEREWLSGSHAGDYLFVGFTKDGRVAFEYQRIDMPSTICNCKAKEARIFGP
jgi:hypothetical protein